jgi:hypothetical protein
MTGATSAGLSLYEAEPAPGVFRWHHLHGSLARFEGTTTPRNYSPCGVTLDQNDAVLCSHPERVYDWIAAEDMVIPEVLLVPLLVGSTEPFGTLWMVADSPEHFRLEDVRIARELARFVATALHLSRSEERLREALRQQELLAREMDHRVKNVFAVTESILRLTAAHADSPAALAESLQSRLRALSDAHSLARGGIIGDGSSIDLHELIEAVVQPVERAPPVHPRGSGNRVRRTLCERPCAGHTRARDERREIWRSHKGDRPRVDQVDRGRGRPPARMARERRAGDWQCARQHRVRNDPDPAHYCPAVRRLGR